MVKLKGFDNIELEKEKIINVGSIPRINQVIEIMEGLEKTKEIQECIEKNTKKDIILVVIKCFKLLICNYQLESIRLSLN